MGSHKWLLQPRVSHSNYYQAWAGIINGFVLQDCKDKTFLQSILWYKIESVMFTLPDCDVVDTVAGVTTCPFETKVRVPMVYMI